MKRVLLPLLSLLSFIPAAHAWDVLTNSHGKAAEVRMEFAITDLEFFPGKGYAFTAIADQDGEKLGFRFKYAGDWEIQHRKINTDRAGYPDNAVLISDSTAEIETIPGLTPALSKALAKTLLPEYPDTFLAGSYRVSSPLGSQSPSRATYYRLRWNGATSAEERGDFSILLILDLPMGRGIAYFTPDQSFSGSTPAAKARAEWWHAPHSITPEISGDITTINSGNGNAVTQLRIDFAVTDLELNPDGGYAFNAVAEYEGKPIGFRYESDGRWETDKYQVINEDEAAQTCYRYESAAAYIKEIPDLTKTLEEYLIRTLGLHDDKGGICAFYAAYVHIGTVEPYEVLILYFSQLSSQSDHVDDYSIFLILDLPMNRCTAYISQATACGGVSAVRESWLKEHMVEEVKPARGPHGK